MAAVEPTGIDLTHYLGMPFVVLDWIEDRLERLHGASSKAAFLWPPEPKSGDGTTPW